VASDGVRTFEYLAGAKEKQIAKEGYAILLVGSASLEYLARDKNPIETGVVGLVQQGTHLARSPTELTATILQLGLTRLASVLNAVLSEASGLSSVAPQHIAAKMKSMYYTEDQELAP
jgi:hypothetical protein